MDLQHILRILRITSGPLIDDFTQARYGTPLNTNDLISSLLETYPLLSLQVRTIEAKQHMADEQLIPEVISSVEQEYDIRTYIDPLVIEHVHSLDPVAFLTLMKQAMFDGEAATLVTEICNAYLIMYYSDEDKIRLHVWLKNCELLSTGGANYVLTTSPNPLFALKTSTQEYNIENELLHEYLVARIILNPLRRYIPNFTYSYSYISCSEPIINNGKLYDWCSNESTLDPYIINQLLVDDITGKPLISMHKFVEKDVEMMQHRLMSIYVQVLYALEIAYNEPVGNLGKISKFTHYDLHGGNILIKESREPIVIDYGARGNISCIDIPIMIDYGFSFYEYDGIKYGSQVLERAGIFYESYPVHDIWKLTAYLASRDLLISIRHKTGIHPIADIMEVFVPRLQGENDLSYYTRLEKIASNHGNLMYPIATPIGDESETRAAFNMYKDVTYTSFLDSPYVSNIIRQYITYGDVPIVQSTREELISVTGLDIHPVIPSTIFSFEDMILEGYDSVELGKLFKDKWDKQKHDALHEYHMLQQEIEQHKNNITSSKSLGNNGIFELLQIKNLYEHLNYIVTVVSEIAREAYNETGYPDSEICDYLQQTFMFIKKSLPGMRLDIQYEAIVNAFSKYIE